MSNLIVEAAAYRVKEARESIRRAEERLNEAADRLNAYMLGEFILPDGVPYQFLQDQVTACRASEERAYQILAGAQRNYDNTLAAQNRGNLVV
jgi:hypothetical protein